MSENIDRVPDGFLEDDGGGRGDGDADECVERHGRWQADGLAENLIALGFGVTGEIGDVERKSRPEADHASERGDEIFPKLAIFRLAGIEGGRLGKHGAETARGAVGPAEQQEAEHDEERSFEAEQQANGIDALVDDPHVDAPKKHEAEELREGDAKGILGRSGGERGDKDGQDFEDGIATNPCLDAKPTAGDESAKESGDVGSVRAKGGATKHGEGNAVARSGVGIQNHWNEDDEVRKEDGENRLPPVHAAIDERGGKHVSGNAGGHGNPERGEIPHAPFTPLGWHGREVGAVEVAAFDGDQLIGCRCLLG